MSSRLKRVPVAAAAVAVAVTVTPGSAHADPRLPDNTSDAVKQLRTLSREAEKLTEKYKKAQDDHAARTADLKRATAETDQAAHIARQARAEESERRGKVNEFTRAAYQGARLNELSALLVSENPKAFLDRASVLDSLAKDNNEAIQALSAATDRAESAQHRTEQAQARAAKAVADVTRIQQGLQRKKASMDARITEVKQQYEKLSSEERDSLSGGSTSAGPLAGSGVAVQAVNAALSKQGSPYVYGAKGPDQFDCSGLVHWAYEQAGVSLPGSTQTQVEKGQSVSRSELKPGDVIFYYSSSSHNGIYIGGGKVVHAPTQGQNVKVEDYKDIGDINRIRRYAG
ncbi:cell wall-associated NlpC family hydrolase [Saccharopolyspora lacisalsi]|uniref:Cell wall-associated NlpC family hydrolase n=1 Tax=Halosaccharopolyspora lacisalsi TaxID=1000566 RepID=A0A839DYN8_9PSEU|nr:NlpC/P60 family protein [Halosaccharopolyspora lacisalsi]MBA8824485.1 cell wall-associated NlpC family hydrolase [Halosaccharopolyspora lacisalsi]